MYYLGPLRQSARRVYQSSGETPPHVGALGEHTIAALLALTEQGRKLNHGPNKKRQPSDDAAKFLAGPVLVEEKLDGANLGFSVAAEGVLLAQNRGHYLLAPYSGQFARLRQWLAAREERLLGALGDDLIAFGEWCAARHSLAYSTLPDWWLLFDIYDRRVGRFWSTARRNAWAVELGLLTVPPLLHGKTSLPDLQSLVCTGRSAYRDGPLEGVVIRHEDECWLLERAKLVRADFTQQIAGHWRKRSLEWNRLNDAAVHG